MNDKRFFAFLEDRKQAVLAEIQALSAEGRNDEANILKAKSNVYDIGRSMFQAADKLTKGNAEELFPVMFGNVTGTWRASLEQAKANGDERKILVEEAKISAVDEIKAEFDAYIG